jgi:hypothetical protein
MAERTMRGRDEKKKKKKKTYCLGRLAWNRLISDVRQVREGYLQQLVIDGIFNIHWVPGMED